MKILALAGALSVIAAVGLYAQAPPTPITIEDAVKAALAADPAVESAQWDWLAASSKADAAWMRMFPSLTASAGYTRLSELDDAPTTITMTPPVGPPVTYDISFPAGLPDVWTLSVNLQYPVFAGFRIREAANLASLTAQSKLITVEMVKRSLAFETRRAYWETMRASANAETLKKNLDLVIYNRKLVNDQAAVGAATQADVLAADMRVKQAEMDLAGSISMQKRVFLTLASLLGKDSSEINLGTDESDALEIISLATKAEGPVAFDPGMSLDEKKLIDAALSRRPETRMSSLGIRMAEHAAGLARAPLFPTLAITGNYTFADPNQRVFGQTDPTVFTGTWSIGAALSFDIGGLPANINESVAADKAVAKARSDSLKAGKSVILDVQTCILNLNRARHDLDLVKGMVAQAAENARVTAQRRKAGTASNLEQLTAELALLRANFAVTNKDIDLRIAAADLARALATDDAVNGPAAAAPAEPAR
ncbi:MAG: TolC family protein [Spirochaetales bacterium]|nr:TolC family protein [Spirochaetales bacterium]